MIHLNPAHSFIEDLVSTTRIDQDTSTCRAATIIAKKQTDMVNHTLLSRPVFAGAELDFLGGSVQNWDEQTPPFLCLGK